MQITTRAKAILGGIALVGTVAIGGSAFTAGGVSNTAGAGNNGSFVGGRVSQDIKGAVITGVAYDVDNALNKIDSVTLTFDSNTQDGKAVALVFTPKSGGAAGTFTCENIGETTTHVSVCLGSPSADTTAESVAITVTS